MKLSDWCRKQGICYMTGYKWFKSGKIPNAIQMDNGTILVQEKEQKPERIVIYCRVSNQSRRKELNYQVDRCKKYCIVKGYQVHGIYKEVASGMNDNRKEFWKMIESNPTKIVVENKDRLTRFGFEYINRIGKMNGIEIEVMCPSDNDEEDLMKDMISIVTSFCCRLYGLRRGHNKARRIKEELEQ